MKHLTLRLPDQLHAQLVERAQQQRRSLHGEILKTLEINMDNIMMANTYFGDPVAFAELSRDIQVSFLARCIRDGQPHGAGRLSREAGLPIEVLQDACKLAAHI